MSDDLDEQRRRLGVAQVEALFGSILIATATASATSLFIAAGLISLGYVALGTGLAWVVYLHALGICNLALRSSTYDRGQSAIVGAPGRSGLQQSISRSALVLGGRRSD